MVNSLDSLYYEEAFKNTTTNSWDITKEKLVVNSRNKGQRGEREFCDWISQALGIGAPERNLDQTRDGGYDVPLEYKGKLYAFEVKRCQVISKRHWWEQVCRAVSGDVAIQVVAYRANRQPWRFLIGASWVGYLPGFIEMEKEVFLAWMKS